MSHPPNFSRLSITVIAFLFSLLIAVSASGQSANQSLNGPAILDLIHRQKYNDAITRLEQVLEREPANSEALTYMATANLYQNMNFVQALKDFENAFKAGGGATFFVAHSHENFTTADAVDYCRGWLYLRRDSVEFAPIEGPHGFKLQPEQIQEFKTNRLSKKVFHIKVGGKSQNFRGRSNTDLEPLLIIALYKSFNKN